jgi:hypothetical protein
MSCISSNILIRLRCLDRQAVDTLTLTKKNRQTPQKDRQTPQRHTSSEIFFTDEREISWRRVMVPLEHARATGAGLWFAVTGSGARRRGSVPSWWRSARSRGAWTLKSALIKPRRLG